MVFSIACLVLAHDDVEDPVQLVLDPPMAAGEVVEFGGGEPPGGDVVTFASRGLAVDLAPSDKFSQARQAGPAEALAMPLDIVQDLGPARLDAAVIAVDGLVDIVRRCLGIIEEQPKLLVQGRLRGRRRNLLAKAVLEDAAGREDHSMNNLSDIRNYFLDDVAGQIAILSFVVNLILAALLSYWVERIYIKHGATLSNRPAFAKNFVLISLTTMLIISIVKSSLALSLGLIGALSIVRFRAAIKEPEELSYLFLAIAVGLGMGAGQRVITIVAILAILGILRLKLYLSEDKVGSKKWDPDLYLTVSSLKTGGLNLDKISEILEGICAQVRLKRADITEEMFETLFLIEMKNANDPHDIEATLRALDGKVKITFLETT